MSDIPGELLVAAALIGLMVLLAVVAAMQDAPEIKRRHGADLPPAEPVREGDDVFLASGGPPMVVCRLREDACGTLAICEFHDSDGHYRMGYFAADTLRRIPDPEGEA